MFGYSTSESFLLMTVAIGGLAIVAWWLRQDDEEAREKAAVENVPGYGTNARFFVPGSRITHFYKWSRDSETFAKKQIDFARWSPRDAGDTRMPVDCVFKINHEIADPTSPREDGLQLVIEAKMEMTLDEDYGYILRLVPLRGTDFWPIVKQFMVHLGEPTLTISGAAVAGGDMPNRALSTFAIYCTWPEGQIKVKLVAAE